jgi:hypothetical protein
MDGRERNRPLPAFEPWVDVAPGLLPRYLDDIAHGRASQTLAPGLPIRQRNATDNVPVYVSLDDTLDQLMEDADAEPLESSTEPIPQQIYSPTSHASSTPNRRETDTSSPQRTSITTNSAVAADSDNNSNMSPSARRFRQSVQDRVTRVFGSPEEIASEDYRSPVGRLFEGAWARYRRVEEERRASMAAGLDDRPQANTPANEPPPPSSLATSQELQSGHRNHGTTDPVSIGIEIAELPANPSATDERTSVTTATGTGPSEELSRFARMRSELASRRPPRSERRRLDRDLAHLQSLQSLAEQLADSVFPAAYPRHPRISTSDTNSEATQPGEGSSASIASREDVLEQISNLHATTNSTTAEIIEIQRVLANYRRPRRGGAFAFDRSDSNPPAPTFNLDNDPHRPEALTGEQMNVQLQCQVCYTQIANVALVPCGHTVMCNFCSDVAIPTLEHARNTPRHHSNCPICRRRVQSKLRLYFS